MRFLDFFLIHLVILFLLVACNRDEKLFRKVSAETSGIRFSNTITESDSINILDFSNVYNGGGVAVGDFNNDGREDIYFTGNLVENKLYLNKGGFTFQDITAASGTSGNGKWCRGVVVVDINNDGWKDMYVSATIHADARRRENILYINQGNDEHGIPRFVDMAGEYGLADTTHTTQAAFFDYDNDGDLDVYLCVNVLLPDLYPNKFRPVIRDGSFPSTGRLYRNDQVAGSPHPFFTDVSREAGITIEGYGHAVTISDINLDGWKDIYVTNDYLSSNILYINNGNGTFTDKISSYLKHSSANAMGADINDINNDGLMDIIELDMNPEDNFRKKMMLMPVSYQTYQNSDQFGYHYQYVRNTLQVNMGSPLLGNGSLGDPVFAELGFFSNIAETDWSWAPVVADFDNDSYRDIIVTNGFPKDITDHDFAAFRQEAYLVASKQQLLEQIPEVKLPNYAFRNNRDLRFTNETVSWGLEAPSFSNGAVYADLDNDGDLDLVINNINEEAFLYENRRIKKEDTTSHYLQVKLEGDTPNRDAFGTWIKLFYNDRQQVYEYYNVRGYLGSVSTTAHFGLGTFSRIDSMVIIWPDNRTQTIRDIRANRVVTVKQRDATKNFEWKHRKDIPVSLFTDITDATGIRFLQQEIDYIDFNVQKLLPHKLSEYGPALAAGDINGDGLDDLIAGGSYGYSARVFIQNDRGRFDSADLHPGANRITKTSEDLGIALFDADNDHDLDLYIASGGYENPAGSFHYRDQFYLNDGKGNFSIDTNAIPVNFTSKSCVKAADFDQDGDLDLFIGGRVEPWQYPKPVSSFIYRNDSKNGLVRFTDVTAQVAPMLKNIGLICDALWSDFDNDGWMDLVLAGEWMPFTLLKNNRGQFVNSSVSAGVQKYTGAWNSITGGDFDNDGDMDYVVSNTGLNSFYRTSDQYPVKIYAGDFDKNGNYDAVPSLFLPAALGQASKKEFSAHGKDDLSKQMIETRSKFTDYQSFARATIQQYFRKDQLDSALVFSASFFQSGLFENKGDGRFAFKPLPDMAQVSTLFAMVAEDFNGDGNLDLVINGNDYGSDVSIGRYDALNGLVLKGNGDGTFTPCSLQEGGIYIPGNGRAFCMLSISGREPVFAASQNRGELKLFSLASKPVWVKAPPGAVAADLFLANNKKRRVEFPTGSAFLSQSVKGIIKTELVKDIKWIYAVKKTE